MIPTRRNLEQAVVVHIIQQPDIPADHGILRLLLALASHTTLTRAAAATALYRYRCRRRRRHVPRLLFSSLPTDGGESCTSNTINCNFLQAPKAHLPLSVGAESTDENARERQEPGQVAVRGGDSGLHDETHEPNEQGHDGRHLLGVLVALVPVLFAVGVNGDGMG